MRHEFLKKYYSADRTKGLALEFKGFERNVLVMLPDVAKLTDQICDCLANFVEIITLSPVYKEILFDKSTIENYYEHK